MKEFYTKAILHITLFEERDLLTSSAEVEEIEDNVEGEQTNRIKSPLEKLNSLLK